MLVYAQLKKESNVQDINLYHLLKFYVKKWPWIIGLTIIGGLAGFIYNTYLQVPLYKSNATLLIVSIDPKVTQDTTLINNYIELIKSRRVLAPVISDQHDAMSYDDLAAAISATNQKNTEVINVSVSTKNADESQHLTDGILASFKDQVKKLYKQDNISVVDNASLAAKPYNVHKELYLAIASGVGLLLAVAVLFFVYDYASPKKRLDMIKSKKKIKKVKKQRGPSLFRRIANKITSLVKKEIETEKQQVKEAPIIRTKTAAASTKKKIKTASTKKVVSAKTQGAKKRK